MGKYRIIALKGKLEPPVYTEKFCIRPEDVCDVLYDDLCQIVDDMRGGYKIKPIGQFKSECDAEALVVDLIKQYLSENKEICTAISEKLDDGGNIRDRVHIDMTHTLQQIAADTDGYISLGYIEDCLLKFAKQGKWHIDWQDAHRNHVNINNIPKPQKSQGCIVDIHGKSYFPILWFGIDEIIPLWSISSQTNNEALGFWFTNDVGELFDYMGNFSWEFKWWYDTECGCTIPDMKKILSQCPVKISEYDTVMDVMNRTVDYLLESKYALCNL